MDMLEKQVEEDQNDPVMHRFDAPANYFETVWNGENDYEIRKNDCGFRVGDSVTLFEWNRRAGTYSGRKIRCELSSVQEGMKGIYPGYALLRLCNMVRIDADEKVV